MTSLFLVIFCSSQVISDEAGYESRMILVSGTTSRLMDGDPYARQAKPLNYNRKQVLPFFLKSGWNIRSVYVNKKAKKTNSMATLSSREKMNKHLLAIQGI